MKYVIFILLSCTSSATFIAAQDFVNNDLNGTVTAPGDLPTNWQNVPYTYVNCNASPQWYAVTPDLTSLTGPQVVTGVCGNPYSGTTFLSGLWGRSGTVYWHEGIMQTVSGFGIGQSYTIYFHQAVVKQSNAIDQSGSWSVYMDNGLLAITPPSFSTALFGSNALIWDAEAVSFVASASTHVFYFLPADDDTNTAFSYADTTGALRMGIDSICIGPGQVKGIHDVNNTAYASVYPNPFSGTAIVQFSNPANEACTLTVYDHCGRIVRCINNSAADKIEIEKRNLAAGLYTFEVHTERKILARGKLMIE